ncbi:MAG TPA: glycosyltransferase family 39 protein, partial [Steroidobacteraceae bacterium]|nr:glycosyltransferase family 39 protein [Steroidobacteraceae bacterium]
ADLPPLVPLIAAATQAFGLNVTLLRIPAVVATLALIAITAEFARVLGGSRASAWMAAVAVAIAPLLMATGSTLGTPTFEPLCWTLCAYALARAVIRGERNAALWAGVIAGLSFEAKYSIAIWIAGLAIGIAATAARRMLAWRQLWYGVAAAVVIGAPSLFWQQSHGWPFLETIHYATAHRNLTGTPIRFEVGQILAMNFLMASLWIAGIVAPAFVARLKSARLLSIAFVVTTAIVIGARGKEYYLAPAYPTMFAAGAVACERLARWARVLWFSAAVALTIPIMPVVLPMLDPPALADYLDKSHLRPRPVEIEGIGAPLTQVFSDEVGWRAMEKQVAEVYRALPPADRARAAIMTQNYGEAAALDVYGGADGLPPALCGQLQYWLWGTHGYDGSVIIHVNGDPGQWSGLCRESKVIGSFGAPYTMPYENGPIILCRGMRRPLPEMWPLFRRYR